MSDDFQTAVLAALAGIRTDVSDLKTRIDVIEVGQDSLRTELHVRFDDLRDRQTQMRAEILHRMEVLQDAVTSVRADVTVNNATAFAAREVNENTRNEVRTLAVVVNGIQLQVQRLQSEVATLKGEGG